MGDFSTEIPDIAGMSEQDAHEHIYYQYRNAKRNWRRFTGRPVHRFRRSFKKSHLGCGKGNGSFGRRTPFKKSYNRGRGFWVSESVMAFLQSKGKGSGKSTTGKGFGRKGNPRDRNGEIMKCRICNSTEHLMARCPRKGEGKGSSSSSAPPGFAAYADAAADEGHHTFLARNGTAETEDGDRNPSSLALAGTEDGDRGRRVSFSAISDAQRENTPEAPRPPWEQDETFELPTPTGYLVLSGEDVDDDSMKHVFMMQEGQDPLQAADPWQGATFIQACPFPPQPPPTLQQRVSEALSAVGDTIRRVSRSPSPASRQSRASRGASAEAMLPQSGYPQACYPPWMQPPAHS